MKECIKITDLKDMIQKQGEMYGERPAYKIRTGENQYRIITHKEVENEVNALGTALISLGLKGKRIAVIGENRYEWQLAYLAIVCGTGMVVPLDKSLPENELKRLIERSEIEAIIYSGKYEEKLKKMVLEGTGKLKTLISMDTKTHHNGIYSESELVQVGTIQIQNGNREFLDRKINPDEMNIMLFTSGTTSESKVVALSHNNICSNLMDLASVLNIDENDKILSFLPLHHVFECTVGFLFSLYRGCRTSFCDGIKYIMQNLNEYEISFACFVPAIFESMYKNITKKLQKEGKLELVNDLIEKCKDMTMEEKKEKFKEIHDIFGGNIRLFISGAAALDKKVEEWFRNIGINLCQGYGLTETSPVIAVEREGVVRPGSIGKVLPHVEAKIFEPDNEGMGELIAKGPNIMLGYYNNVEATKEAIKNGWFHTGDLAIIDKEGYIFIKGRKKSVIVLKNGKNIFPEEMENLVNRIEGVKESFIFGKSNKEDKDDIKIYAKIVFDRKIIEMAYGVESDEEIHEVINNKVKEINKIMPPYKSIRGIVLSENPLIKTTTGKIKRQEEMKTL